METMMVDGWAGLWSAVASLLFLWSVVQQYVPFQLEDCLATLGRRLHAAVSPFVTISIDEHVFDSFSRSDAYLAAEAYLSASCAARARLLRANLAAGTSRMTVTVDDHEEVMDEFRGAKLWWRKTKALPRGNVISFYPREEERRTYRLTFHRRHRALVESAYLPHVLAEGRAVTSRNRQRRLFTNNPSGEWGGYDGRVWSHVKLEHPSTFATLGMEPGRKQAIVDDLEMFRHGKDYYASVGKAWKRGYLLFGPPGTGKSTMIAAMANYLDYDIYDLELTAVKSNTELRRLFIETTGKSIIVIEDIDCSVDLTSKRKKAKKKDKGSKKNKMVPPMGKDDKDEDNKVTLSGLLNFIDGLWSACGGERIIIFTTNHKDKLDPALIRRGRMDMHIEMSYCCFESFKVLAKNYLGVSQHELLGEIRQLLGEVNMTPADVAENLMPKSNRKDVGACLGTLVKALKEAKEEALAKALAGNKEDEEGKEDDSDEDDSDDEDKEEKKQQRKKKVKKKQQKKKEEGKEDDQEDSDEEEEEEEKHQHKKKEKKKKQKKTEEEGKEDDQDNSDEEEEKQQQKKKEKKKQQKKKEEKGKEDDHDDSEEEEEEEEEKQQKKKKEKKKQQNKKEEKGTEDDQDDNDEEEKQQQKKKEKKNQQKKKEKGKEDDQDNNDDKEEEKKQQQKKKEEE